MPLVNCTNLKDEVAYSETSGISVRQTARYFLLMILLLQRPLWSFLLIYIVRTESRFVCHSCIKSLASLEMGTLAWYNQITQ